MTEGMGVWAVSHRGAAHFTVPSSTLIDRSVYEANKGLKRFYSGTLSLRVRELSFSFGEEAQL
jgi:hypothetical protein